MEDLEQKTETVPTKVEQKENLLTLSHSDAVEYYSYKRQQKTALIMGALARSEGIIDGKEDVQRAVERALRIHQAAVRVTPTCFAQVRELLPRGKVRVDCFIGGNGETLTKVKAYEGKLMRKLGAEELTVAVTPSLLESCRYAEIKKELRKLKRTLKTSCFKVWTDRCYPYPTLARLGRICSEVGVRFYSIPYFEGCERLRFDLFGGCRLEVVGVETLEDFKRMTGAGVGRVITRHGFEMYSQWIKEVDEIKMPPIRRSENVPQEDSGLKFV